MRNDCGNCEGIGEGCRSCGGSGLGAYYDSEKDEARWAQEDRWTRQFHAQLERERQAAKKEKIESMLNTLQANGHNCSFDTECYRHAKTAGELEIDYRVTIQEELETHKHHSNSIEMVEGYLTNFINQRGYQHV